MKNREKPMPILLIEDNEIEVNHFKDYFESREDVKLVAATNSSYKGIEDVKTYVPEGIILDLELHKGEGSGITFLEDLQKIALEFKPLIVVTTNVSSSIIYSHIRDFGADFIFYKKQKDYSPEMVVNAITSLRETLYSSESEEAMSKTTTETPAEHKDRIAQKIENELDLIGVATHLKGRKYIFDAIFYLLDNSKEDSESAFSYVASVNKVANCSVSRAMQTAINYAWRTSSIDDLEKYYTARINYHTGVPTPTELIYYYADKIKKIS